MQIDKGLGAEILILCCVGHLERFKVHISKRGYIFTGKINWHFPMEKIYSFLYMLFQHYCFLELVGLVDSIALFVVISLYFYYHNKE